MLEFITEFFKAQPVLAGMGSATAAGVVLGNAKALPGKIWNGLTDQFSVSVQMFSEDQVFESLERWLSKQPSTRKMRRLHTAEWYDRAQRKSVFGLAPGAGLHAIWLDGRPFFIHRMIEDSKGEGGGYARKRKQTITITTPGRSQTPILDLVERIRNVEASEDVVPVYYWNGVEAWRVDDRPKRSMETVYLDPELKVEIIDDLRKFLNSREQYHQRGTPWRRGYCFTGIPGVGKTTMIFALASLFSKAIYIIPLSAVTNDKELLNAINAAGDAFVVIEDVDSVKASESRETALNNSAVYDTTKAGITRSGLLNALDGIGAREGRVLFMTTNSPEVLDEALLRDGRIDVNREFSPATAGEAKAMFMRFFPEGDAEAFVAEINHLLPLSQAALQNLLLSRESINQTSGDCP